MGSDCPIMEVFLILDNLMGLGQQLLSNHYCFTLGQPDVFLLFLFLLFILLLFSQVPLIDI